MFKKSLFAILPIALLAVTAHADDNVLDIDVDSISVADVEVLEADFDIDVDQLSADAGAEESEDAIEACFRRFGYRSHYRGWGCGGFRYNCYRPFYSYRCYRPIYHYSYCAPIYNCYWGCY